MQIERGGIPDVSDASRPCMRHLDDGDYAFVIEVVETMTYVEVDL